MASASMRPCRAPFCKTLVRGGGYCERHASREYDQRRREAAVRRDDAAATYHSPAWRKARAAFLIEHPLCVDVTEGRCYERATVVDHVKPHRGNEALFWDESNWQPLCKRHHDKKTAREDGGFGNGGQSLGQ